MKQISLFEKEHQFDSGLVHLIDAMLNRGKLHKYLEVQLRAYSMKTGKDVSLILKALRELEDKAKDISLSLNEISSSRPLKRRNLLSKESMDKYYRSKFSDDEIVIDADTESIRAVRNNILKAYSDIFAAFARISSKNGDVDVSDMVRIKFLDLMKAESDLSEKIDRIK